MQKSVQASPRKKIELKKSPSLKKNKKYSTHDSHANRDSCTRQTASQTDKKIFHSGQTLHRGTTRQQPTSA